MTISNSIQFVPRERIHGAINGVDFGPRVSVIARGEKPALLWLGGHSWTVNGNTSYAEGHLTLIVDRKDWQGHRHYRSLSPEGGRLTVDRVDPHLKLLEEHFNGYLDAIRQAIKTRTTLLIEGGGKPFSKGHTKWHRASRA